MTVALQGEQGKPRPALVVQADSFSELSAVTVLPITGALLDAPLLRIEVAPTVGNGLAKRSQIMVDKVQTPSRIRIGAVFGHIEDPTMVEVNRALAVFLGLA